MIMEPIMERISGRKLLTKRLKLKEAELLDIYGRRRISTLFGLPSSLAPKGISINT
jgi:hypothetical protein